jgi:hypothetical protein
LLSFKSNKPTLILGDALSRRLRSEGSQFKASHSKKYENPSPQEKNWVWWCILINPAMAGSVK